MNSPQELCHDPDGNEYPYGSKPTAQVLSKQKAQQVTATHESKR